VKMRNFVRVTICTLLMGAGFVLTSWSSPQGSSAGTVPVKTIVSVEAKYDKNIPEVQRQDVRAFLNGKPVSVADWVPLRGDQAGLELFILIDESINQNVSLQFDDLRNFINSQPATTSVGVGYMRNGIVQTIQNLTADHALAGKALRLPIGPGAGVNSPYLSLSDLAKRWPESPNRRAVLMVSDGIDAFQYGPNSSYVEAAVDRTQQSGIQVYAIYDSGIGHYGHSSFRIFWGQNNLAQLAEESGGESYIQGLQPPVAFAPYLEQLANRLMHQYRLTILANPGNKANFQSIRLETEVPNAQLITAPRVYVPAAK
jgi:hypothetical protein